MLLMLRGGDVALVMQTCAPEWQVILDLCQSSIAVMGFSTAAVTCIVMDNPSVHLQGVWDRLAADKLTDNSQHASALWAAYNV